MSFYGPNPPEVFEELVECPSCETEDYCNTWNDLGTITWLCPNCEHEWCDTVDNILADYRMDQILGK